MQEMWVRSLGRRRSPGGDHGNPLQYSSLEAPMDRGVCWATVRGVTKSLTQLSTEHEDPPEAMQVHQVEARVLVFTGFIK